MTAAALSLARRSRSHPAPRRRPVATCARSCSSAPRARPARGRRPFDVVDTKGTSGDRILFSKWNSFSRVAVYDRPHGDWSLSPKYTGRARQSLFMDIDSAASTPILKGTGQVGGRRLPALRADGASAITLVERARRASRRWSSDRAAAATCCRRSSSARARRWRGDQSDHRARRDARPLPRLLGRHVREPPRVDPCRRRAQLRAAQHDQVRRDPGVARRYVGRNSGRRLHADGELALHDARRSASTSIT